MMVFCQVFTSSLVNRDPSGLRNGKKNWQTSCNQRPFNCCSIVPASVTPHNGGSGASFERWLKNIALNKSRDDAWSQLGWLFQVGNQRERDNERAESWVMTGTFPPQTGLLVESRQAQTPTAHTLDNGCVMDVNSLYNTGNLTVELKAPVSNWGNDEMIICSFFGQRMLGSSSSHGDALCQELRLPIDGSRGARAYLRLRRRQDEAEELPDQYPRLFLDVYPDTHSTEHWMDARTRAAWQKYFKANSVQCIAGEASGHYVTKVLG